MEDDLEKKKKKKTTSIFFWKTIMRTSKKWKTTSIFFFKWKTTSVFLKMEDDLNFWDNLKKIIQQKAIKIKTKNKSNGCGTAPGNLVFHYLWGFCLVNILIEVWLWSQIANISVRNIKVSFVHWLLTCYLSSWIRTTVTLVIQVGQ